MLDLLLLSAGKGQQQTEVPLNNVPMCVHWLWLLSCYGRVEQLKYMPPGHTQKFADS